MRMTLLELLRCPQTGTSLSVEDELIDGVEVKSGWLVSADRRHRYPVRDAIPRFVPETNYADSFGMQWTHFRRTQLDSNSGHPISAKRFWKSTQWAPQALAGEWVLDVGCGAGRFAEVVLDTGARVVALDYSNAVDACYANLKHHPNLHVVQGDIYSLPFAPEIFAYVYCLGVLQHTPDVAKAFSTLPRMLRPNGQLCTDFYEKTWTALLHPKYLLRPLTKRLPRDVLFRIVQRGVPVLLPISRTIGRIPQLGGLLSRLVPVANYYNILPLNDQQQKDWSLLDTFDWLSPQYDHPQRSSVVRSWMQQAGMQEIQVLKAGHLVARGKKSNKGAGELSLHEPTLTAAE